MHRCYLTDPAEGDAAAPSGTARWRSFFVAAGAADGLSFVVTASKLPPKAHPANLRKSGKNVVLPYGLLGVLSHKQPLHLDATLSADSAALLQTACWASGRGGASGLGVPFVTGTQPLVTGSQIGPGSAASGGAAASASSASHSGQAAAGTGAAVAFAELLARLSVDDERSPTPSSCPALAASIRGDTADDAPPVQQQQQQQHRRQYHRHGGRAPGRADASANNGSVCEAYLSAAVPSRARGICLQAGQPGACVFDIGESSWAEQLRASAWVPVEGGGLVAPPEALLQPGPSEGKEHLKLAALPPDARIALARPPLASLLRWGTAPPPSPMSRFTALVEQTKAARAHAAATTLAAADGTAPPPAAPPTPGLSAYLAAWRALAAAQVRRNHGTHSLSASLTDGVRRASLQAAGGESAAAIDRAYVRRHASESAMLPLGRTLVRLGRVVSRAPPQPAAAAAPSAAAAASPAAASPAAAPGRAQHSRGVRKTPPANEGRSPGTASKGPAARAQRGCPPLSPEATAANEALVEALVQGGRLLHGGSASFGEVDLHRRALMGPQVQQGWLLDVWSDPVLREVGRPLQALLELPRVPDAPTVQRWLQQVWRTPPPPPSSGEGARLKTALSLAMRYCVAAAHPQLDVAAPRPPPPEAPATPSSAAAAAAAAASAAASPFSRQQAHRDAIAALPGLRLWCASRSRLTQSLGALYTDDGGHFSASGSPLCPRGRASLSPAGPPSRPRRASRTRCSTTTRRRRRTSR